MVKAIKMHEVGGPKVMSWEDVEVGQPGTGEVRIRHTAVGLNFVDVNFRKGIYKSPLPFIPSRMAAGVVTAVGPGLTGMQVGDRVAYAGVSGAYSEERLISAAKIVPLPSSVHDVTAAAILLKGMTAQFLLRRCFKIHRDFRKPLIVVSPKNLLRHQPCKSNLSEFDDVQGHPGFDKQGTRFKRLIKDSNFESHREEAVRRLVLCSGKVYYELDEEKRKAQLKDLSTCRVEQLCPFPWDLVLREINRYPNAEIVWCQEEPMNMGACTYVSPRLGTALRHAGRGSFEDVKYFGRAPSAATATGFGQFHVQEQKELVHKALQEAPILS